MTSCADDNLEAAAIQIHVDDRISRASTCIEIECRDRKVRPAAACSPCLRPAHSPHTWPQLQQPTRHPVCALSVAATEPCRHQSTPACRKGTAPQTRATHRVISCMRARCLGNTGLPFVQITVTWRSVQGLLYDAMRTADAAGMLMMQARCSLQAPGRAVMQLFVRDGQPQPLADDTLLLSLLHQLLYTIARPLSVAVRPQPLRALPLVQ